MSLVPAFSSRRLNAWKQACPLALQMRRGCLGTALLSTVGGVIDHVYGRRRRRKLQALVISCRAARFTDTAGAWPHAAG